MGFTLKNAVKAAAVMLLSAVCALPLDFFSVGSESVIMVFLLGVLFTAVLTSSKGWAIGSALFAALLFNYLFTEPRLSFFMYSTKDLMLIVRFLITGIVSGTVASRLQSEMLLANQNGRTARSMYEIASGFLSASGREDVLDKAVELVGEYTGSECTISMGETDSEGFQIKSGDAQMGRLRVSGALTEQQRLIVQAVCTQLGIALEREGLVADREKIRFAMEREQQRSMLLRSIAHDLRSPLTALYGAGSVLSDRYDELSDVERRKLACDISEEIVWLTDLVENILSMTRISEDKLALHKQDEVIDDVIGEAVKHTERLLRDRTFTVKLPDVVATVPMDGKLIVQVIINLLENAVKHTPPESRITLCAAVGKRLTVSVADTGEGIPTELRGRLFERFVTQNEEIVDGRRGLGLGLAICKTIVEAHGGEIHVEDNKPGGAIFTFTLPMEEQNEYEAHNTGDRG